MNNYVYIVVSVVLVALSFLVGKGCASECNLAHVATTDILAPKIDREERADSVKSVVAVMDSGLLTGIVTTTTEGKKAIKTTLSTGTAHFNVDIEYDPTTEIYTGSWSYVAVREIIHYFTSMYERISYPTVHTVTLPDTDDWQWFGIGGGAGVALSIIVLLLLL